MFKQFPPVTKNLLIINGIIFLAQLVGEQRGMDLTHAFGLHFVLAEDFAPWQLVTYMFLHADLMHLIFNMFTLWMFGRIVEQTMGLKRFLIFYFVCGIGAGICQELFQLGEYYYEGLNHYEFVRTSSAIIPMGEFLNYWTTIGASGACYGVLLAFGMAFPNERIMLLIPPIPIKAKYFVVGYAAIELLSAFSTNGNIAHFAHLGGMLFGLLLILYWRNQARRGPRFKNWETWTPRRSRSFWERLRDSIKQLLRNQPKMRVKKGGSQHFKDRDADYDYNKKSKEQEEQLNKILDKIKRNGYQSLTDEEKRLLFENSKK